MRGNKTTATKNTQTIVKVLKKYHITDIGYGIIIPVYDRRDHRTTLKITEQSGCLLVTITGKRYKQELRIYDVINKKDLKHIIKENINESFRLIS